MEGYREPPSEFENRRGRKSAYQSRKLRADPGEHNKNRRAILFILLVLFLIVIAGASLFWYLGSRSIIGLPSWLKEIMAPQEEIIQITLPKTLFAGKDITEVIAAKTEEAGLIEIEHGDGNTLIYTMTAEALAVFLDEAEANLEEKIAAMQDKRRYPHIADLSNADSYSTFNLLVNPEHEQYDQVLITASELFMLAVYYQHIAAAGDSIREVSIFIEESPGGALLEKLVYPGDLNLAASLLELPAETDDQPRKPQAGDKVIVSTGPDNLNLRNGPEITYLIIDILRSGTILEVTGSEGLWLAVITPEGREGWVHGGFVDLYPEDD